MASSTINNSATKKNKEEWDIFEDPPIKRKTGSMKQSQWIKFSLKLSKLLAYLITFIVVLGAAVVSKGTLLFMTSQISPNRTLSYCNKGLGIHKEFLVQLPPVERLAWIWMIIFSYFVVQLVTFIRSLRMCLFKTWSVPRKVEAVFLFVTESLPAVGSALLVFCVLPELDVLKGVMLTNALCFVPAVAGFFAQEFEEYDDKYDDEEMQHLRTPPKHNLNHYIKKTLYAFSILAQASAFIIWPVTEDKESLWMITPISVILISFGWLENYVPKSIVNTLVKKLTKNNDTNETGWQSKFKKSRTGDGGEEEGFKWEFENSRYFAYLFLSVWKCILFFATTVIIMWVKEGNNDFLFQDFVHVFEEHDITVTEIKPIIGNQTSYNIEEVIEVGQSAQIPAEYLAPVWVFIIHIGTTYICYAFGKFACKITIQEFGYAFPINLVVPVTACLLIVFCGIHSADACAFYKTIPPYLFFNGPPVYLLWDFIGTQLSWIWLLWLLSQSWITIHLWSPKCEQLASTEKLYVKPMYDAFFIDQSIAMNRRRHDVLIRNESTIHHPSETTKIYCCATMWHEEPEEMEEFLKSIVRLDEDQFARKTVKEVLDFPVNLYYDLETHIFFDDAFDKSNDHSINKYVSWLIEAVPDAIKEVHNSLKIKKQNPTKSVTPYGGCLEWVLPGQTKMIVHLKDKNKIRVKKRWSQVMYMYYLLGFKLMNECETDIQQRSNNTFILALDGDIDFQPSAVHHLVTLMKRNPKVGAACGRIHPLGSGPMVWYQIFEYSIGHWLQKATEHMIGCVLCSPGCFSLFRGSALMDDNVMAKYTSKAKLAKHFLQYDQGEDRWLCTLLLQRGYRVEFCAASDSFTHAPEQFSVFYNQRRRWIPSTTANILDLLLDNEHTVKMNDNISMLYITYQTVLMVGTVLGPGTIFLMLVGSFVAAFEMSQWASFMWNAFPIILFICVCYWCNYDIQLFFAGVLSAIYGLVMMAVLVGVMLQITVDGPLAPSSLFFFGTVAQLIITGILHPNEMGNLLYGVIYYVTIPSMYLLLVIYSIFNLNERAWGTRDDDTSKTNKPGEEATIKNTGTDANTKQNIHYFDTQKMTGSLEFSFAGLFTCMLCTQPKQTEETVQLLKICESIEKVSNRLDEIEEFIQGKPKSGTSTEICSFESTESKDVPLPIKPSSSTVKEECVTQDDQWLKSSSLENSVLVTLPENEKKFWDAIINDDSKLKPYAEDKKQIAKDLLVLRDKTVAAFLMLNSIFVLVVFLLTLKKDIMHIKWPLNVKVNFTYIDDAREIKVYKEHLQLEPIGVVFLFFFASLLFVQFIAMLFHRFGTFAQILASTYINWSNFIKLKRKPMNSDERLKNNPVKCVKTLTKPPLNNKVDTVERRETVKYRAGDMKKNKPDDEVKDLEEAIKRNCNNHDLCKTNPLLDAFKRRYYEKYNVHL